MGAVASDRHRKYFIDEWEKLQKKSTSLCRCHRREVVQMAWLRIIKPPRAHFYMKREKRERRLCVRCLRKRDTPRIWLTGSERRFPELSREILSLDLYLAIRRGIPKSALFCSGEAVTATWNRYRTRERTRESANTGKINITRYTQRLSANNIQWWPCGAGTWLRNACGVRGPRSDDVSNVFRGSSPTRPVDHRLSQRSRLAKVYSPTKANESWTPESVSVGDDP